MSKIDPVQPPALTNAALSRPVSGHSPAPRPPAIPFLSERGETVDDSPRGGQGNVKGSPSDAPRETLQTPTIIQNPNSQTEPPEPRPALNEAGKIGSRPLGRTAGEFLDGILDEVAPDPGDALPRYADGLGIEHEHSDSTRATEPPPRLPEQMSLPALPPDPSRAFAAEMAAVVSDQQADDAETASICADRELAELRELAISWANDLEVLAHAAGCPRSSVQWRFARLLDSLINGGLARFEPEGLSKTFEVLEGVVAMLGAARNLRANAQALTGLSVEQLASAFASWYGAPPARSDVPPVRREAPVAAPRNTTKPKAEPPVPAAAGTGGGVKSPSGSPKTPAAPKAAKGPDPAKLAAQQERERERAQKQREREEALAAKERARLDVEREKKRRLIQKQLDDLERSAEPKKSHHKKNGPP